MKAPALSRRNVLLGGAALGVTALGVGGYGVAGSDFDFFKTMLRAELPGVTISDESIRAFATDALTGREADFMPKLKVISSATRVLGFESVAKTLGANQTWEQFHRDALTRFLLGSNFFQLADPRAEEVVYFGPAGACATNPFAQFEPPL